VQEVFNKSYPGPLIYKEAFALTLGSGPQFDS
jgi:hypothetical protein